MRRIGEAHRLQRLQFLGVFFSDPFTHLEEERRQKEQDLDEKRNTLEKVQTTTQTTNYTLKSKMCATWLM